MKDCVIALDVGGSSVKAAIVDDRARLIRDLQVQTPRDTDGVLRCMASTVDRLRAEAGALGFNPLAVGAAVPGIVDEAAGVAVTSANLGWRNVPVRARLADAVGLDVAFGHDVRAGGLAEAVLGAGRGVDDFLFLPIGTGISGALVLNGEPYPGRGYAGEIGHMVIRPGGLACPCGNAGCLETVASAAAIARRFAYLTNRTTTAADVGLQAADGNPVAVAVWDEAVQALATALAAYISLLAPDLIVVGGGLATAGDQLLGPLQQALAARLTFHRPPKLVRAALGYRAGCLGAALLAWRRLNRADGPELESNTEVAP